MNAEGPSVRIVVRRPRHAAAHHGGAWKVAYADFVTTMMALFIVLWIVGESQEVRQAVAQYFKDPGVFTKSGGLGDGILPGGKVVGPGDTRAREERALQETAARLRQLIERGGAFENLREQVRIEVTAEGLRIDLAEQDRTPLFEIGSAVPIHPLTPLLQSLQRIIGTLPNHITVEGHTDSRRYSDPSRYSNWELSTDRANAARRIMEADGLPPGRIDRVVGHADRMPARPDDRLHASNRRITLLVRRDAKD